MSGAAALRKRAFKLATISQRTEGFALLLDDKPVRTPAGATLHVPTRDLALALAEEWNALGETIEPLALPLTRLANTAVDGTALNRAAVEADFIRQIEADLVCYRARDPESLVARHALLWDPLLRWANEALGLTLHVTDQILHVAQPQGARETVAARIAPLDPFTLTALHLAAGLTGSVVIALALSKGRLDAAGAFEAAHADEIWQSERWGIDAEAQARLEGRKRELETAARFITLCSDNI